MSRIITFFSIIFLGLAYMAIAPQSKLAFADACDQYATNRICNGQAAYDTCSEVKYDGNRAYFECKASQNSNCTGKIYCSLHDRPFTGQNPTNINPATNQPMAPTCGAVRKTTTCNQETYEGCTKFYRGNEAYYRCVSPQNDQCVGEYRCQPKDKSAQVTPTPTPAAQGQGPVYQCNGTLENRNGVQVCVAASAQSQSRSDNTVGGSTAIAYGGSSNITLGGTGSGGGAVRTAGVKELPKTGLPLLAWAGAAFLPLGFGLKRFNRGVKETTETPNFMWEERKFKAS